MRVFGVDTGGLGPQLGVRHHIWLEHAGNLSERASRQRTHSRPSSGTLAPTRSQTHTDRPTDELDTPVTQTNEAAALPPISTLWVWSRVVTRPLPRCRPRFDRNPRPPAAPRNEVFFCPCRRRCRFRGRCEQQTRLVPWCRRRWPGVWSSTDCKRHPSRNKVTVGGFVVFFCPAPV